MTLYTWTLRAADMLDGAQSLDDIVAMLLDTADQLAAMKEAGCWLQSAGPQGVVIVTTLPLVAEHFEMIPGGEM